MKLKPIVRRMLSMCPEAWYIFIRCIQLSAALLLGAVILLIAWDGCMERGYKLYMTAMALAETCQALLLTGVLVSVCIEDIKLNRK